MKPSPGAPDLFLRQRYDAMWADSIGRIRSGAVEVDATLASGEPDRRRGMTLVLRPSREIQESVAAWLEELRAFEPEQYFYQPSELHVTFLSLFTSTEQHEPFFARAADYLEAVGAVVATLAPFPLAFSGVTASAGAVVVQGFTDITALNAGRDRLRAELCAHGFAGVDARYRLETAHMTVARFRRPLRNAAAFAAALTLARSLDFGTMTVASLELTRNDWYMSRGATECLRRYELQPLQG